MYKKRLFIAVLMVCFMVLNIPFVSASGHTAENLAENIPEISEPASAPTVQEPAKDILLPEETPEPAAEEPKADEPAAEEPAEEPSEEVPAAEPGEPEESSEGDTPSISLTAIPQPAILVEAETIISSGYITGFVYSGFTDEMMNAVSSVTAEDFSITGADSSVTGVEIVGNTIRLTVKPFDPSNGYNVIYSGTLLINLSFSHENVDSVNPKAMSFILRNENYGYDERTVAAIIDAGKDVDGSSLDASLFSVHARNTRRVDPSFVAYEGPRTITAVYTSEVHDYGTPSESGRYIIVEFLRWGEGGENPDGGAMDADGYTLVPDYTITYNGGTLECTDGTVMSNISFRQTGVVSPVLDKYQYGNEDGLDYSYFINEEAEGPLPLVVFFHGGGQGNDTYTPIRFSNGGTVWANPENQARYPCHVLCPRNAVTADAMEKVVAVIDKWVDAGLVDPNRVYVTGFSMGGMSTWTFLNTYPDVAAAAIPICAAGTPASVEAAKSYANLPIWAFVTRDDFLYNLCMWVDSTYGPYMKDYRLTVLKENKAMMDPYNGWVFDPHCAWIPVYNEYTDENGQMAIDWLFAQNRAFTDLKDKLDELISEIESGKYTYESAAAAQIIADEVSEAIAQGIGLSDIPELSEKIDAGMAVLTLINQVSISAAPNSVLMGDNRSVTFNISVDNLQKVSVMEGLISISDSRFEITDISTSYTGENSLFTKNVDYYGDGTTAYFSLAQVGGFADAARFDAATVTVTLKSDARIENGESIESVIESVKMYFGTDGETYSGIVGEGKASTKVWNAGDTIGDLDGNDIVNGNDLAIAMTFFAMEASDDGWFTSGAFAVDVNGDGIIDMADLSIIAYIAAHIALT